MQAPCYRCEDRYLGCHSDCDRYKAFCREREEIRKARLKESEFTNYKCAHYGKLSHDKYIKNRGR